MHHICGERNLVFVITTSIILKAMTPIDKTILHGWIKLQLQKTSSEDAKLVLETLFEDFYLEEVEEISQEGTTLSN